MVRVHYISFSFILLYVSEPLTQLAYNNTAQYNSITALQREDEGATPFVVLVVCAVPWHNYARQLGVLTIPTALR